MSSSFSREATTGRYKSDRVRRAISLIVTHTVVWGYLASCFYLIVVSPIVKSLPKASSVIPTVSAAEYQPKSHDFTDDATKAKIEAMKNTRDGLSWYRDGKLIEKTHLGSITMYSRLDSCHNPKDGKCLTAIGEDTQAGKTIACPRSLPLKKAAITVNGITYPCEDRTAKWVETKFGPTYDIFVEDQNKAIQFGRQTLPVTITVAQ